MADLSIWHRGYILPEVIVSIINSYCYYTYCCTRSAFSTINLGRVLNFGDASIIITSCVRKIMNALCRSHIVAYSSNRYTGALLVW